MSDENHTDRDTKTPAADLASRVEALEATLARIAPLIGELPPPVPEQQPATK